MTASAGIPPHRIGLLATFTSLCWVLVPHLVAAQVVTTSRTDPKWTAEFHGSVVRSPAASGGAAGQFPAGTTFRTEPGFPSRANPSWYFGDGAALFNEVNAQFASRFNIRFTQLAPLDGLLTSASIARQTDGSRGFRIAAPTTTRVGGKDDVDRALEQPAA